MLSGLAAKPGKRRTRGLRLREIVSCVKEIENGDGIECGCFCTQTAGAQCDRLKASLERDGYFEVAEIAFWSNQNKSRATWMVELVKRATIPIAMADEAFQIQWGSLLKEVVQKSGSVDCGAVGFE